MKTVAMFLSILLIPAFAAAQTQPCPLDQPPPCPLATSPVVAPSESGPVVLPPTVVPQEAPKAACQSGLCLPYKRVVTYEGLRPVTSAEVEQAMSALQGIPAFQQQLRSELKADVAKAGERAAEACASNPYEAVAWGFGGTLVGVLIGVVVFGLVAD